MLACTRLALHKGKEMNELHYGKNAEWFLRELSAHEAGDIESAEIEVIGENDQGVEGSATIDITLLAADAVTMIAALQQKLDAVLAGLDGIAGAMLNRTLDSGSKQASAYADCADMLARYNAQLRAETDTTPSQYESLAGGK